MAFKFILFFTAFILFITTLSYSDSPVSASIRVSAFVEQPLGLSYIPQADLENSQIQKNFSGIEYGFENQLLLRIPENESAICIMETFDGKQLQYLVSEDLLPLASINDESDVFTSVNQITIIYTEN